MGLSTRHGNGSQHLVKTRTHPEWQERLGPTRTPPQCASTVLPKPVASSLRHVIRRRLGRRVISSDAMILATWRLQFLRQVSFRTNLL